MLQPDAKSRISNYLRLRVESGGSRYRNPKPSSSLIHSGFTKKFGFDYSAPTLHGMFGMHRMQRKVHGIRDKQVVLITTRILGTQGVLALFQLLYVLFQEWFAMNRNPSGQYIDHNQMSYTR